MAYQTPVRDMRFALYQMAGFGALERSGAYGDLSQETVEAILSEAGKFCDNVIAPINVVGDRNPVRLDNGIVRTSPGWKDAYQRYAEAGWTSLAFPEEWGGQALPSTLSSAFVDALNGASMAFAIGTTLSTGAIKAILAAGTDQQKAALLPKLISGEWTATMNLTEPQSGSDLSGLRTRAEPMGDGRYRITGEKIFITYGDHDMTANIIHLVLARLPDAPDGTAGISMFVVPKFHLNKDGSPGARNDLRCARLEEKLGLHASPTCVMAFGENHECYGSLLGEENKGLKNMFVMMNAARLDVGLQGVGVAEAAFQRALRYAQERLQGRAPGVKSGPMIPIYEHLDVRRMLYSMKAMIEASRAICYANAVAYDLARHSGDDKQRAKAKALEELLTPISKGWSTDRANDVTSLGVQVHGGMGYIEETGAAQHMRDARIAAIYEGTNGIQAIDLVGRKLQGDGGAAALAFISDVRETATIAKAARRNEVKAIGARLLEAADALKASCNWLLEAAKANPDDALAGATPFLRQFGNVAGGYYLTRGALAAALALGEDGADVRFLDGKIAIAHFYAENFLVEATGLTAAVGAGAAPLERLDPAILTG